MNSIKLTLSVKQNCHTRAQLTISDPHMIQLRAEDRVWPCSAIAYSFQFSIPNFQISNIQIPKWEIECGLAQP